MRTVILQEFAIEFITQLIIMKFEHFRIVNNLRRCTGVNSG